MMRPHHFSTYDVNDNRRKHKNASAKLLYIVVVGGWVGKVVEMNEK